MIGGYQVVVKLGDFEVGGYAYYIPPDNVVSASEEFSFLWRDKVPPGELIPTKYRRVTARRFRKEWSEGLLMPIKSTDAWAVELQEGDDVSDIVGITHYQPPEPEDLGGQNERGPRSPWPRSWKGWVWFCWYRIKGLFGFHDPTRGTNERGPKHDKPFYDIENAKNYRNAFSPGEPVVVTEKIHGCQGRFVYQDGHQYAGSRRLWKSKHSKCIWRKCLEQNQWIGEWCKNHEGYTLYGEVVPCQGDSFMYGCKPGEVRFYVFDILTPEHEWVPGKQLIEDVTGNLITKDMTRVPPLYIGGFDEQYIKSLADGKSTLDSKTIREGVVTKPLEERHVRGLGRLILKTVSNIFLEKSN